MQRSQCRLTHPSDAYYVQWTYQIALSEEAAFSRFRMGAFRLIQNLTGSFKVYKILTARYLKSKNNLTNLSERVNGSIFQRSESTLMRHHFWWKMAIALQWHALPNCKLQHCEPERILITVSKMLLPFSIWWLAAPTMKKEKRRLLTFTPISLSFYKIPNSILIFQR